MASASRKRDWRNTCTCTCAEAALARWDEIRPFLRHLAHSLLGWGSTELNDVGGRLRVASLRRLVRPDVSSLQSDCRCAHSCKCWCAAKYLVGARLQVLKDTLLSSRCILILSSFLVTSGCWFLPRVLATLFTHRSGASMVLLRCYITGVAMDKAFAVAKLGATSMRKFAAWLMNNGSFID